MNSGSKFIGDAIVFEIFFVVLAVYSWQWLHVSKDIGSNVSEGLVRDDFPAAIIEIRHVNCLPLL